MRVVFVDLAALSDATFVSSAIAEAFGVGDATESNLTRRVRAACADRQTLLVLDNCEHVLDAVPLLGILIDGVACLRVLATSRAPLRIRGEREYFVGPLATERESSDVDAPAPALRLLVDRIHDFDPEFRLGEDIAPVVAAICQRLDALPLAIELAAPWLKVLSADDLLRRLERDVLSPTIGRRDLPARQQTMNATVAWSYQLLAADEQRAFRRLGVLPGSFPVEAAAAVQAEDAPTPADRARAQSTVAGLIERSLLQCVDGSCSTRPLYRMLETVRAYATTELVAAGEYEAAMEGLIRYTVSAAAAAHEKLVGPAQGVWLDHVRDDLESFRQALTWLIGRSRCSQACEITWQLLHFWLIRGHSTEGLLWYDHIARVETRAADVRAKALAGAGVMLYAQGQLDLARRACEFSANGSEDVNTLPLAVAENILGHVELASGNVSAARERFTRAGSRFQELGAAWGAGNSCAGLAWCAVADGDLDAADRYIAEATNVLAHAGPWSSLIVLYVRSVLAIRRSKPMEAIALARESLSRIHALHDKFALVYALAPLAAAAERNGDDAWAARIVGLRDAISERTGATAVDYALRDLDERVERATRTRLGPRHWAREYEAGRGRSLESLLKEVEDRCRRSSNAPAAV
jgi:predicted ATPase